MKKQKKLFISMIVLFLVLIFFGTYLIAQNTDNKFSKKIKDNTPHFVKELLRKTIFYVPLKYRELNSKKKELVKLKEENKKLSLENDKYKNKTEIGFYSSETIEGSKSQYFLKSYILPFFNDENLFDNNKKGYLEIIENKILVIFGSGKSIVIDKDKLNIGKFHFIEVKNNILNSNFFDSKINWAGVKDIKVYKNKVLLSLTKYISPDCYNTSLFESEFNDNTLNFLDILQTSQCINSQSTFKTHPSFKNYTGYQTGGRIDAYKNNLYLTVGDYNDWEKPQDDQSIFGKVIQINKNNDGYILISKGHRNQQGMEILKSGKMILTEHGPKGGDEINLIDLKKDVVKNFGWPLASYGVHYDSVPLSKNIKKIAPLKKSHKLNGFEEPIKYFTPSIGISQIIKNFYSNDNSFFVTSLKKKTMYNVMFDNEFQNPKIIEEIEIGERIRDIIYDENEKKYYLYLEGSPKILLFSNFN